MTDFDDLVSRVFDGEATPEEVARVEADPDLRTRLEAFESVRSELRQAPPIDDDDRESAITAALDAFEPIVAPRSLTERRAAESRTRQAFPILAAAAAVLVVVLAVGALAFRGGESADKMASAPATAGGAATEDQASRSDSLNAGGVGASAAGSSSLTFQASTLEDLATEVRGLVASHKEFRTSAGPTTTAAPQAGAPEADTAACNPHDAVTRDDLTDVVLDGTAQIDGAPVTVHVFGLRDGGQLLVVIDDQCRLVADPIEL